MACGVEKLSRIAQMPPVHLVEGDLVSSIQTPRAVRLVNLILLSAEPVDPGFSAVVRCGGETQKG